ncbi:hypothetical protein VP01_5124g1 [Puccinia sorghi]|uniref:Uncharacterized protein n=1 Tax=Puccinia sorghi TaxID=27349 RepID=A0A0L6UN31_9BASI|nr:hypothetical protein VP01_5124g1 [Puccinia sorghi]
MDPSHNTWAAPANQSVPVSAPVHVSQTQHHYSTPTTSAPTNPYESIIEKLTGEIESLKATINLKKRDPKPPGMKPAGKSSIQPAKNLHQPPELMKKEKPLKHKSITKTAVAKASPKRHPQQMQNGDFPPSFLPTKVCLLLLTSNFITALFVHIKILWGLLKQDVVVNSGLANRPIRKSQVECLKNPQNGHIKYSKLVIHLGSNFVRYTQGLMAQLGLSIWCPNLDEDSASLYNTAHRIAALTTFTKLAATSAYAYLKANPKMSQDISLLIPVYTHLAHYLQFKKYKKELKQKGKVAEEASNKKFNKNRERVSPT